MNSLGRLWRGLVGPRPLPLSKPIVLQFPVVDICNSRCQMCHIWKNKRADDIGVEALRRGLDDSLFDQVESVGINGGEPTLRPDLAQLCSVLYEKLPSLRNLSLITNGYLEKQVNQRIDEVGEVVRAVGGHLDVMVSLDGYGEIHDLVRGKPGNFERAGRVLDHVLASPLVHKVRIGCTIIRGNARHLHPLHRFCLERNVYVKYRIGIPHQRLYTADLDEPFALSPEEMYEVVEFMEGVVAHYEPDPQQRFFYRSLVDQLVTGSPRRAGCDWQHRGATITSGGDLLYCSVASRSLGSITEGGAGEMYFGNQGHLREILARDCDSCRHDYVGIPPRSVYARQIFARLVERSGMASAIDRSAILSRVRSHRSRHRWAGRRSALRDALPGGASDLGRGRRHSASRRVMLCGWYGTETVGDKAILAGVAKVVRHHIGEPNLTLASLHPYLSRITVAQMPELEGLRIVDTASALQELGECDLLVLAGGPLMAGVDELADLEALFGRASALGIPSVVAGCGVGPLGVRHHDRAVARILRAADARVYRDEISRSNASLLGVDVARDEVAEDPAHTWLSDLWPLADIERSTRRTLLLGLRDFPYREYARSVGRSAGVAMAARYEASVVECLSRLLERDPSLELRPLPMCTNHFGGDDRWFYHRLLRLGDRYRNRIDVSLLGKELAPLDYALAFREASAALTMRFHSLVFAVALGCPAVAIDYTDGRGKVAALVARHQVPAQRISNLDPDRMCADLEIALRRTPGGVSEQELGFSAAMRRALSAAGAVTRERQGVR